MRHFVTVYEKSQRSKREMTEGEWKYLEHVDRLVNG